MVVAAGCAVVGPPRADRGGSDSAGAACAPPELHLHEGQPRGLVVVVERPVGADGARCYGDASSIILARRRGDESGADFTPIFTFSREDPSSAPLWESGSVPFLDQDLVPEASYAYVALADVGDGAPAVISEVRELTWLAPPHAPTDVGALPLGGHVHVRWSAEAERGALVFRRKVGDRAGYARVSPVLGEGAREYIDGEVERGAVYAYIVSAVQTSDGVPIIGAPSAEVYVEAMPTGPLGGQTPEEGDEPAPALPSSDD